MADLSGLSKSELLEVAAERGIPGDLSRLTVETLLAILSPAGIPANPSTDAEELAALRAELEAERAARGAAKAPAPIKIADLDLTTSMVARDDAGAIAQHCEAGEIVSLVIGKPLDGVPVTDADGALVPATAIRENRRRSQRKALVESFALIHGIRAAKGPRGGNVSEIDAGRTWRRAVFAAAVVNSTGRADVWPARSR